MSFFNLISVPRAIIARKMCVSVCLGGRSAGKEDTGRPNRRHSAICDARTGTLSTTHARSISMDGMETSDAIFAEVVENNSILQFQAVHFRPRRVVEFYYSHYIECCVSIFYDITEIYHITKMF